MNYTFQYLFLHLHSPLPVPFPHPTAANFFILPWSNLVTSFMYPSWSLFQLWAKCSSFAFPSSSVALFRFFIVLLLPDFHYVVPLLHSSVSLLCQTFQFCTPLVPVLHFLVPVLYFPVPVVQSRFNFAACLFQLYLSSSSSAPQCSHYVNSLSHICTKRLSFTSSLFLLRSLHTHVSVL